MADLAPSVLVSGSTMGSRRDPSASIALGLLVFPALWFVRLGMPEPEPELFLKLLGDSFLALVVGYASGLRRLHRGDDVRNIVWVSITSNGSSFLILLMCGIAGAWRGWGIVAQPCMWASIQWPLHRSRCC